MAGREHGLANAGGSEGALVAAGGGESEGTEGRSQLPQIAGSCSRPLLRGKVSYRSVALNLFKHISYVLCICVMVARILPFLFGLSLSLLGSLTSHSRGKFLSYLLIEIVYQRYFFAVVSWSSGDGKS